MTATNSGIICSDISNLTMDKMQELIREIEARDPRMYAELQLCASLRSLPIQVTEMITGMVKRGLFDALKDYPVYPKEAL